MAKKHESNRNRVKPLSVIMLILAAVITLGCAVTALTPDLYDIGLGSVAEETIYAPRDITDLTTTNALKENARKSVPDIYRVDKQRADRLYSDAALFFENVKDTRTESEKIRAEMAAAGTLAVPEAGELTEDQWRRVVSGEELVRLKGILGTEPELDDETVYFLLSVNENELLRLKEIILPKLHTALNNVLSEDAVASTKSAFVNELNATSLSDKLKKLGEAVIESFLQATYTVDLQATEQARNQAANAVSPVVIKRGEIIVEKGAKVSQPQLNMLLELEMVRQDYTNTNLYIGSSVYVLMIFTGFGLYLILFERKVLDSVNSSVIVSIAIIITMLLALLANRFDSRITPGLIAVIITSLLVSERAALAAGAVMALCIGLIAGGRGTSILSFDSAVMTASMLASSSAAVFKLKGARKRSSVIVAGVTGGGAAALVIAAVYIMLERPALQILADAGKAMGSDAVATVLCAGTLTVWENIFDVATAARLTELSSASHPLLKQLMTEAPGTYHHSVMTAQLAEAAAERIGADSLLAMVGATYHDVGKLRRPLYFRENQKPDENVHDLMTPEESAAAIISHQKDGVSFLHKHKLPSAVIRISHEHHGNSLVSYFYHKALTESEGKPVNIKAFRYPGSRPTTKESAIVMLSDCCEASVRSLKDKTRESVEEMVHKVIKGALEGGQLNNSPLTLFELEEVESSFLRTLYSLMHERIEYPDTEKAE